MINRNLIQELSKRRVAISYDADIDDYERLEAILSQAFPVPPRTLVKCSGFFFANGIGSWTYAPKRPKHMIVLGVKNFYAELPKRGDLIKVWGEDKKQADTRIFLVHVEGARHPFVCVRKPDQRKFKLGERYEIEAWGNWEALPDPGQDLEALLRLKIEQALQVTESLKEVASEILEDVAKFKNA